jgi:hypothetical protein
MFSALTISTDNLDVGAVAEALVYYGRTRLRVTGASLPLLVERLGYNTVIGAIELGALELSYAQVLYGVGSKKHQQLGELHNFLEISVDATADATAAGKSIQTASDQVEEHYLKHFGKSSEVINQARVLAAKVTPNTRNRDILQSAIRC